jgi:hypothetical protein
MPYLKIPVGRLWVCFNRESASINLWVKSESYEDRMKSGERYIHEIEICLQQGFTGNRVVGRDNESEVR